MQHAAQTLAAQNRFAAAPKQTEAQPTVASVATAAAAAFARRSWAAASTRFAAEDNRPSVSGPPRRSFRSVAAVEPEPAAPATAQTPATARRQWKATAKKVVEDDAAAASVFKGLASFGVKSAGPRGSSKVPSVGPPSRWAAAARATRSQPRVGGRWWTAYKRMHGRVQDASGIPDSGNASSDTGDSGGGHMAEIEEHALALLLRVPSRGELQMQQEAAKATAASDEGAGSAARASGQESWGRRQQAPPAALPATLARGGARESQVGPGRGRWSVTAAAVGEGQEQGADSSRDSLRACVCGESASAANGGDDAEAAAADAGTDANGVAPVAPPVGPADGLRDDWADAVPHLPAVNAMRPWVGARRILGQLGADSGTVEPPVQALLGPPVPGGSDGGTGPGPGAPAGADGLVPSSDARPGGSRPLGGAWLRAKELTAPASAETDPKVW